jgi:DNA-binding GntR family transcriptional regulator
VIHRGAPVPPYRQLAQILRQQIEDGTLPGESKLPSILDLAASYEVGSVTVRKAIALLKAEGLVVTVGGYGTFVVAREN